MRFESNGVCILLIFAPAWNLTVQPKIRRSVIPSAVSGESPWTLRSKYVSPTKLQIIAALTDALAAVSICAGGAAAVDDTIYSHPDSREYLMHDNVSFPLTCCLLCNVR